MSFLESSVLLFTKQLHKMYEQYYLTILHFPLHKNIYMVSIVLNDVLKWMFAAFEIAKIIQMVVFLPVLASLIFPFSKNKLSTLIKQRVVRMEFRLIKYYLITSSTSKVLFIRRSVKDSWLLNLVKS